MIVRVFDFVPPPQDLEHLPHAPQAECWQLTGQRLVLHTAFILSAPHLSPPNWGCLVTLCRIDMRGDMRAGVCSACITDSRFGKLSSRRFCCALADLNPLHSKSQELIPDETKISLTVAVVDGARVAAVHQDR